MKKKQIKTISIIMAIVLVLSVVFSVSISVYADDTYRGSETSETESTPQSVSESSTQPTPTLDVPPTTGPQTVKVGDVKGLKKSSSGLTSITIKWKAVKGASGYYIYRRNADKQKSLERYKTVKKTSITFKKLSPTTQYQYGVRAFIKKKGRNYYGKLSTLRTATNTLDVKKIKLKSARKNISVQWNKVKKATGYIVYRASSSSKGKYVEYKKIKGNSKTRFTDKAVKAGKLYYYRVKAYRTYSGIGTFKSGLSTSRVFTTVGLDAVKISASSKLYRVTLSWKKNKAANEYKVYYSKNKKGKYKKLTTTSLTSYETKGLKKGTTYYFKVVPCKVAGKTTFTSTKYNIKSQKVSNKIFGRAVGNSYVEVDTKTQHMWMYKKGKLITETDVVTGNDDGVHNTPKGIFSMMSHDSPSRLVGDTWDVNVSYWMQFTSDGCGIHDSTWRGSWEYGGTTYKGNGSHGCVNTPLDKVAKIFKNSYVGYTVVVR